MNREEAARIIDTLRDGFSPVLSCEQYRALGIAIKALKAQEWIPLHQRLPEDMQDCLVSTDASEILCATFYEYPGDDYDYDTWDSDYVGKIIAWMPLPKPYKAESEDKE